MIKHEQTAYRDTAVPVMTNVLTLKYILIFRSFYCHLVI
uniref:Uncharacterized protein n=1 Tax=Anguilla anguilla TaxID=7936 RepID=A0A0E9TRI9_ANGAN